MLDMARLPNCHQAVLDIEKIADYCLNPAHPRGRHKARIFRELPDISRSDAPWFRQLLLTAVRDNEAIETAADEFGRRWRIDVEVATRQGKSAVIRSVWIIRRGEMVPRFPNLLDTLMTRQPVSKKTEPAVLDPVALLTDRPAAGLARGQVGTVVEKLAEGMVLVEFSDDDGRAYAVASCPQSELLILHYVPEAA
jgi:hypothetical protein